MDLLNNLALGFTVAFTVQNLLYALGGAILGTLIGVLFISLIILVAMSLAGMAAVSWVSLTNVVVRVAPFQCTTEPNTKPVPLVVSVKPAPPATAVVGDTEVRTGTGFFDFLLCTITLIRGFISEYSFKRT